MDAAGARRHAAKMSYLCGLATVADVVCVQDQGLSACLERFRLADAWGRSWRCPGIGLADVGRNVHYYALGGYYLWPSRGASIVLKDARPSMSPAYLVEAVNLPVHAQFMLLRRSLLPLSRAQTILIATLVWWRWGRGGWTSQQARCGTSVRAEQGCWRRGLHILRR